MDVVRHHDVAGDDEIVADTHNLQRALKELARRHRAKLFAAVIAAKRDEVETATFLITYKAFRHGRILLSHISKSRCGPPNHLGLVRPRASASHISKSRCGPPNHPGLVGPGPPAK